MLGAALGDRLGRRRVFVGGMAVFVLASVACACSPTIEWLVASRVVQGAGAALVVPVALALVSAAYPADVRGRAIGTLEGVTGLATIGGPVVGGAIAGGLTWQAIFWVNVPIGVAVIVLALRVLEESHGEDTTLHLPDVALVTTGALGVVWGLVHGSQSGWTSGAVVLPLVGGALLLAAFVTWQARAAQPLLPPRLLRSRAFSAAVAAGFFLFATVNGSVFFMAQFLQTVLGHGPLAAGLLLVPWTATLILVAPVAGALSDRVGERLLVTGGLLLTAGGFAALALLASPEVSYWHVLAPLVVAGIGMSAAIPAVQVALIGAVDDTEVGKASGVNNTVQEFGGAFGVAVLVAAFTAAGGGYASAGAFSVGFAAAAAATAAFALTGAVAAAALPDRRPAPA